MMPLGPQLGCRFPRKLVLQSPIPGHPNISLFCHGVPCGSSCRRNRERPSIRMWKIWDVGWWDLRATGRSSGSSVLAAVIMVVLCCDSSLRHSRLALPWQQPITNQLQVKHRKRIALHLLAHMLPVFTTRIRHMCGMVFTCIFFFIQVSRVTMLTYNVSYSTPMLHCFDSSIDT